MNIRSTIAWIAVRTAISLAFLGLFVCLYAAFHSVFTNETVYDVLANFQGSFWTYALATFIGTSTYAEVKSRMTLADRAEFARIARRIAKVLAIPYAIIAFGTVLYYLLQFSGNWGDAVKSILFITLGTVYVVFAGAAIITVLRKRKARPA